MTTPTTMPIERDPTEQEISPILKYKDPKINNIPDDMLVAPYYAKVLKQLDYGQGYWKTLKVGVFKTGEDGNLDIQVGEYVRNYHTLYKTFYPFKRYGQWYALYSKDYTATRIMSLPDCKDIGGEEPKGNGFCPVEYYVPQVCQSKVDENGKHHFWYEFAPFGFVSGCVWGDDSSWKVQYLDLTNLQKGEIKRDQRLGYIALPESVKLSDAFGDEIFDESQRAKTPDTEHTYQFDVAIKLSYRVYPDGTIRVFGVDDIAKSTRNDDSKVIGEEIKLHYIDLGDKIKGPYEGREAAERRFAYLQKTRLNSALEGDGFDPKGIIEVNALTTESGYSIDGVETEHHLYYIDKEGKTGFANDNTCDLHNKSSII